MLRNFRTIRPIFPKIAPKVAQNLKEKSHESSRRGKKIMRNYRAKRRGGADSAPPPGPFRVNNDQKWGKKKKNYFLWTPTATGYVITRYNN